MVPYLGNDAVFSMPGCALVLLSHFGTGAAIRTPKGKKKKKVVLGTILAEISADSINASMNTSDRVI